MKPDDIFVSSAFDLDVARADRGDTTAALRVGYRYLNGVGCAVDTARARRHFQFAARESIAGSAWLGYIDVRLHRGLVLRKQGLQRLKDAAEAGDPVGRTLLGRVYELGLGGYRRNRTLAKALYMAAARHFALANTFLGEMYVEKGDYRKAILLFRRASAAGDTRGTVDLADVYTRRNRKPRLIASAKRLLRLAAERGDCVALYRLGLVYRGAVGGATEQDVHRAFGFFHRSARLRYRPAQIATASCYAKGAGVRKDPELAKVWLSAARKPRTRARGRLRR